MLPHSGRVPPALPVRSPLRPRPLPLSTPPEPVDADNDTEHDSDDMTLPSFNTVISSVVDAQREKPLPEPVAELEQPKEVSSSLPLTKRQHALHELLSSERAYASDLALIREVHIPLALGHTVPLPNLPITPPNSSGSSSRTLSTASDSSLTSLGPPMTPEDVKLIFGNISEIAVFSDLFCQALEEALGALLDGGKGDDHVGALFLSIVSELERPYKQYITRHATALTHLQQLPQTPAIQNYLLHTQSIASSLSHAWDLSSLLIKPVQRLLKYPLLLAAIIDETPDSHPDKQNLREARKQMEEVARNVNEGRRRVEVVRDVLTSKKKGPVSVTVSASVNLTKMKSLRVSGPSTKTANGSPSDKVPDEAILVERLEKELKEIEEFSQKFAKNVVEWARMTSNVVASLRTWALGFAKVIGLSADQGSEAFDAFLVVVEHELMPLCVDLEALINERVLKELAHLLMTMTQPLKLLASMNEQEPYHYHLMNMNVSAKNRPPPALLLASTNYLALRGQLAAELPTYISLLHRGLKVFIHRLSAIQTEFYTKVRDKWVCLWEMLRLEEELNVGADETVNVWFARWCEVNEMLASVSVLQGLQHRQHRESRTKSQDRDRDHERSRDLEDPEADAEYYAYHHLQAFTHHHSPPIPDHTHPRVQPPPHNHNYGPGSPSSPPSTEPPNSPNSFATSFTSSLSGGQSTERRFRDKASERYTEHKDPPKKKAVAQAQAANVRSMFGALEPMTYVSAAGFVATTAPPLSSPRPGATGSGSGSGSGGGMNSPKADSPNSTRARGNSDVSSYGGSPVALLSGVGLGLGGTGVFSSPMISSGGWKKKTVSKKGSNESLKSKATATAAAAARSPQIASASVSTSTSATIVAQQPAASDRGQGQGTSRPPYPPRNPTPHPQRRRTTAGIEPAPEDLREYEIMMMREQERMREKEREREFGHASRSGGGGHHHGNTTSAGAGGRSSGVANGSGSGSGHAHPHQYTHQYGHGLPRTKSMPLPYLPQSQPRAQGQRQEQDASRRVAGEWSEYADEEDSELFYQPPSRGDQYEREETEYRARPRERERKDPSGGGSGNGSGRRQTPHSHSQSAHGRQQSVGKDEERRRHSAHSTYSTKSRDDKRERDKDKDPSSRKRSGSIKSITSFFTSNRDSHDYSSTTIAQSSLDQTQVTSPRDSWALKPSKYTCQVIHPCKPPTTGSVPLSYFSFPFFTLKENEYYDVLQEAGHPSLHPNLPLIVDEGEDCLLLCRAWDGSIGWALASFLEPVGSVEG